MLPIHYSKSYRKSLKKLCNSGNFDPEKLSKIINIIALGEELPISCKDHALIGEFLGSRECHIQSDLVLIYRVEAEKMVLEDVGSHSEMF